MSSLGSATPSTASWPAPQSTTSRYAVGDGGDRVVAAPATSTSEPEPEVGLQRRRQPRGIDPSLPAPASMRTRGATRTGSRGTSGSRAGDRVQASAVIVERDEEPGLVGGERDVVGRAVGVGQDQPTRVDAGLQAGAGDGASASAASSAQAPSTSATIAAYRPSLITDAGWQRPSPAPMDLRLATGPQRTRMTRDRPSSRTTTFGVTARTVTR